MIVVPRSTVDRDRWNDYVDRHPSGWFWHRAEWLDYCLAYSPDATDESVAVMDGHHEIVGVCPAIVEGEHLRRVTMGGTPCAGPLATTGRLTDVAKVIVDAGLCKGQVAFRWSFGVEALSEWLDVLARHGGLSRTGWWTRVQREPSWSHLRKSYRSIIRRALRHYTIGPSTDFGLYRQCHQTATDHCRPVETYAHQERWMRAGYATIVTAISRGADTAEEPRTSGPRVGIADGSSPSPSTICVAASYVITYKDRSYWASGPSLERSVQHACQWVSMTQSTAKEYEIGWIGEPDGKASIEFFKAGFGGHFEPVLVMRSDEW
jgi:hypothetical protein